MFASGPRINRMLGQDGSVAAVFLFLFLRGTQVLIGCWVRMGVLLLVFQRGEGGGKDKRLNIVYIKSIR